jgi:hypothetical protein
MIAEGDKVVVRATNICYQDHFLSAESWSSACFNAHPHRWKNSRETWRQMILAAASTWHADKRKQQSQPWQFLWH